MSGRNVKINQKHGLKKQIQFIKSYIFRLTIMTTLQTYHTFQTLDDLDNVLAGDKNVIRMISESGEKFNKQMARYLTCSFYQTANFTLITDCMKSLYQFYTRENRQLPYTFYEAYDFIQHSPLFSSEVPPIETPRECLEKYMSPTSLRFKDLSTQAVKMSTEILSLTEKIMNLQCNKRQPLELFELQKRYELIQKLYDVVCKEQSELLDKLSQRAKNVVCKNTTTTDD